VVVLCWSRARVGDGVDVGAGESQVFTDESAGYGAGGGFAA
jgi:hypothetical protein